VGTRSKWSAWRECHSRADCQSAPLE
jgi:hypothetical protein